MQEILTQPHEHLRPYEYPLWVRAFAAFLLLTTIYSLSFLPKYLGAAKILKDGQAAFASKNYTAAITAFETILETAPSSKKAKIEISKALFSMPDIENHKKAFMYLQGIKLNKGDWEELTAIMPNEYQQDFNEVKK